MVVSDEESGVGEGARSTIGTATIHKHVNLVHYTPGSAMDQNTTSNQNIIPEYIIPWITGSHGGQSASSVRATENDNNSFLVSDSGIVMSEDLPSLKTPPPHIQELDEPLPYSCEDSPDSTVSTSIFNPESLEIDEELLSAAAAYRHLEALLSSGSYYIDPPQRPTDEAQKAFTENEDPFPLEQYRPSNIPSIFPPTETQPSSPLATDDRFASLEIAEVENVGNWSFEDEITVAVLDAMDQRPPLSPSDKTDHEFGIISSGDSHAKTTPLRRRTASVRMTFEKLRRSLRRPERTFGLGS
jgi:hypothetical protein